MATALPLDDQIADSAPQSGAGETAQFEAETMGAAHVDAEHVEAALARLAIALAQTPDREFLSQFAAAAAREMEADHFFIGRFNPFSNIMRTVRMVTDLQPAPNMTYSLDGTPCARAMDGEVCAYCDDVAQQFPHDVALKHMGIRGYIGVPLFSAGGGAFGIMVGLTRRRIDDDRLARAVIERYAPRVACALESAEMLDRYSWAIAEASDGIWD